MPYCSAIKQIDMPGEEIALTVAKGVVEMGLNKLSTKTRRIVFNTIQVVFGLTIAIIALGKLYKEVVKEEGI